MSMTLGNAVIRGAVGGTLFGIAVGMVFGKRTGSRVDGREFPRYAFLGMISGIAITALGYCAGRGAAIGAVLGVILTHQKSLHLSPQHTFIGAVAGGIIGYAVSFTS